jgi:ADP-heptose:LPS heptosyltransferase
LTPRESAAALAGACLFVGHDSGPMHLAAAMGVRCIGLFGNENLPAKWHPWGEHHLVLRDTQGVRHIGVDAVAQATLDGLGPMREPSVA